MIPNLSDLATLNHLELERYTGYFRPVAHSGAGALSDTLHRQPVQVASVHPLPEYESKLRPVVRQILRTPRYETFGTLKGEVHRQLVNLSLGLGHPHLTTLFGGIYIGNPEDLRNYFSDPDSNILYPLKGFGCKIVEVAFIDTSAH